MQIPPRGASGEGSGASLQLWGQQEDGGQCQQGDQALHKVRMSVGCQQDVSRMSEGGSGTPQGKERQFKVTTSTYFCNSEVGDQVLHQVTELRDQVPIWKIVTNPASAVNSCVNCKDQCGTNIQIFEYIQIYLDNYIHSYKYLSIFRKANIFGYSFLIYLHRRIYSDIHLLNIYDSKYI